MIMADKSLFRSSIKVFIGFIIFHILQTNGQLDQSYPNGQGYPSDFRDVIRTPSLSGAAKGLVDYDDMITRYLAYVHRGVYSLGLLEDGEVPIYSTRNVSKHALDLTRENCTAKTKESAIDQDFTACTGSNTIQIANHPLAPKKYEHRIGCSFSLKRTWDPDYGNPSSPKFHHIKKLTTEILQAEFCNVRGFISVKVLKFRQGSVIVDAEVKLEGTDSEQEVTSSIQKAAEHMVSTTRDDGIVFNSNFGVQVDAMNAGSLCDGRFDSQNGAIHVIWKIDQQTEKITFTMWGTILNLWIAIGMNTERSMDGENADAYMGWILNDGTVVVTDRHMPAKSRPPLDSKQNIENVSGNITGGKNYFTFTRALDTGDAADDFIFNGINCAYFMYAYGGAVDSFGRLTNSIHFEHFFSPEPYCFSQCIPVKKTTPKPTTTTTPEPTTTTPKPTTTRTPEPTTTHEATTTTTLPEPTTTTTHKPATTTTTELTTTPEASTTNTPEPSTTTTLDPSTTATPKPTTTPEDITTSTTREPTTTTTPEPATTANPTTTPESTTTPVPTNTYKPEPTTTTTSEPSTTTSPEPSTTNNPTNTPEHTTTPDPTTSTTEVAITTEATTTHEATTTLEPTTTPKSTTTAEPATTPEPSTTPGHTTTPQPTVAPQPTTTSEISTPHEPSFTSEPTTTPKHTTTPATTTSPEPTTTSELKTTPEPTFLSISRRVQMIFSLDLIWQQGYADPFSTSFLQLKVEFLAILQARFLRLHGLVDIKLQRFREGSVLADVALDFERSGTSTAEVEDGIRTDVKDVADKMVANERLFNAGYSPSIDIKEIDSDKMCEGFYKSTDGDYTAAWDVANGLVTFTLSANISSSEMHWLAIGFKSMQKADGPEVDGYVAFVQENQFTAVSDRHIRTEGPPAEDISQDIHHVSGTVTDGLTVVTFARALDTSDIDDFQFNSPSACAYLSFNWAASVDADGNLETHPSEVSSTTYCFANCPSKEPSTGDTGDRGLGTVPIAIICIIALLLVFMLFLAVANFARKRMAQRQYSDRLHRSRLSQASSSFVPRKETLYRGRLDRAFDHYYDHFIPDNSPIPTAFNGRRSGTYMN